MIFTRTIKVIIVLSFALTQLPVKEAQELEWKATKVQEGGVTVIKNPSEPLFGIIQFVNEEGESQVQLAGIAIQPEKDYLLWKNIQSDSNLGDKEKIQETVNTFFNLLFESWLDMTLLDTGFLFKSSKITANECYSYFRGLMHLAIVTWRTYNIYLHRYRYYPKYYDITVDGHIAIVKMWPRAEINHNEPGPWSTHEVKLERSNNTWLITDIKSDGDVLKIHPRGTDFKTLAMQRFERFAAQKWKHQFLIEKFNFYQQLTGNYTYTNNELEKSITISIDNRQLVLLIQDPDITMPLYPRRGQQLLFWTMSAQGQFFDIHFLKCSARITHKCSLKTLGKEYILTKTIENNFQNHK